MTSIEKAPDIQFRNHTRIHHLHEKPVHVHDHTFKVHTAVRHFLKDSPYDFLTALKIVFRYVILKVLQLLIGDFIIYILPILYRLVGKGVFLQDLRVV